MTGEFHVSSHDDGTVVLWMLPAVASDLMTALRRYNEYRIADGINRDSGWNDVANGLEEVLSGSGE